MRSRKLGHSDRDCHAFRRLLHRRAVYGFDLIADRFDLIPIRFGLITVRFDAYAALPLSRHG